MRVIAFRERPAMAWKNGGGTTVELAASPEGASLDDFNWRVSIAEIRADGPFSRFEGIDRVLTHAAGGTLRLDIGGRVVQLDAEAPPVAFPGEAEVRAQLLDGPAYDLNAMARRDAWRVEAARVALPRGARLGAAGAVRVCVALETCVGTVGQTYVALAPLDALVLEADDDAVFVVAQESTRMVSLVFARRPWQKNA